MSADKVRLSELCTVFIPTETSQLCWEYFLNAERLYLLVSTDVEEVIQIKGLIRERDPTIVSIIKNWRTVNKFGEKTCGMELHNVLCYDFQLNKPYIRVVFDSKPVVDN